MATSVFFRGNSRVTDGGVSVLEVTAKLEQVMSVVLEITAER
jgi:hypothetical protein